jgi:antitoxin (DNA-binding transcriptional repressor) of toxin-antitoxin stability system
MKEVHVAFTEAKANLSKYGRLAEQGRTTLVLKHRRPAFCIAPVLRGAQPRVKTPGLAKGRIRMAPDFDVTPPDVIASFEGSA